MWMENGFVFWKFQFNLRILRIFIRIDVQLWASMLIKNCRFFLAGIIMKKLLSNDGNIKNVILVHFSRSEHVKNFNVFKINKIRKVFKSCFSSFENNSKKYRNELTIRKWCIIWLIINNNFSQTKFWRHRFIFSMRKLWIRKIRKKNENYVLVENL